jgi:4-amino-4-deoxy-L-arabinose transferase-like glycosyltransferase
MNNQARGLSKLTCWLYDSPSGILILILIATILRLPNLNRSLWYDEVLYSTSHGAATLSEVWKFIVVNPCAPLYRILMFFWYRVFGDSELSVRAPSMLFGMISIWLTYAIAKRFGKGGMPFLAGLLLCFSPAHVWYSQEATPYSMTICLLLSTIMAWFHIKRTSFHRAWYFIYAGLLFGTVFTHYFAAVFLLPLTVLSLSLEKSVRVRVIAINVVIALCVALAIGLKFITGHLVTGMGFLRPFTLFEWWMLFFNWFLHGNCLWTINPYGAKPSYLIAEPALLALQVMCVGLVLVGLWSAHREENRLQTLELGLFLFSLPLIIFLLTLVGYQYIYIERYLLMLLPFFIITLTEGATRFSNRWMQGLFACALIAIGVASYAMLLNKDTRWTVYKHNPDWRSTAHYLEERHALSESVVLAVTPADALAYYLLRQVPRESVHIRIYDAEDLDRILFAGRTHQIYLTKNLYWSGNFDQVLALFKRDKRLQSEAFQAFAGVEIHTFVILPYGVIPHFYNTVLGRDPEAGVFEAWESGYFNYALNFNIGVHFIPSEMGRLLFASTEYQNLNRSDTRFITDCYHAFLNRNPSQSELSSWLESTWSRPQVVSIFADSDEFKYYIGSLFPGLSGLPARNFVTTMYIVFLDRLVEEGGLVYWSGLFENATDKRQEAVHMAQQVIASPEFQGGHPTNETIVVRLYRGYLGRYPTDIEIAHWAGELDSGHQTINALINQFANSQEFSQILLKYFPAQ